MVKKKWRIDQENEIEIEASILKVIVKLNGKIVLNKLPMLNDIKLNLNLLSGRIVDAIVYLPSKRIGGVGGRGLDLSIADAVLEELVDENENYEDARQANTIKKTFLLMFITLLVTALFIHYTRIERETDRLVKEHSFDELRLKARAEKESIIQVITHYARNNISDNSKIIINVVAALALLVLMMRAKSYPLTSLFLGEGIFFSVSILDGFSRGSKYEFYFILAYLGVVIWLCSLNVTLLLYRTLKYFSRKL